jgi:hypothetical protein
MPNERLRATLIDGDYDERSLSDEIGLDHKSVQRWITRDVTPRRTTAHRAAKLLGVSASCDAWEAGISSTCTSRVLSEYGK